MKIGFLFPGQGSQYVGMGRDFFNQYNSARELYQQADDVLGTEISKISFSGPEKVLRETQNAQVAILLHSLAVFNILIENGITPYILAGHSSGEYSAIIAAGGISTMDGIRLLRKRGELMSSSSKVSSGHMAAIVGLSAEKVEQICREVSSAGLVNVANYNAPDVIIISGSLKAVGEAVKLAKKLGATRSRFIAVDGAFHSPLMKEASDAFLQIVKELPMRKLDYPIIANSNAAALQKAEEVRKEIEEHMLSAVQWQRTIELMFKLGVEKFIEVGPGKVFKGLALRINRQLEVLTTSTVDELTGTIKILG